MEVFLGSLLEGAVVQRGIAARCTTEGVFIAGTVDEGAFIRCF